MTQRGPGQCAGTWEFPGGAVKSGETSEIALARELKEELGVPAIIGDLVDIVVFYWDRKVVVSLFHVEFLQTPTLKENQVAMGWHDFNEAFKTLPLVPSSYSFYEAVNQLLEHLKPDTP